MKPESSSRSRLGVAGWLALLIAISTVLLSAGQGQKVARGEADGCLNGWISGESTRYPDQFTVWLQCTGDYEGDLATAIAIIESFWQDEIDLMGTAPKPDRFGGDAGTDVYIVGDANVALPGDPARTNWLSEGARAIAVPEEPIEQKTCSGYIVARRSKLADAGFPFDLAHELFHLLQYAHNYEITHGYVSKPYGEFNTLNLRTYWFLEATAVWFESYEFRSKVPDSVMVRQVHRQFLDAFQGSDLSLADSPDRASPEIDHIYAAYIWFSFMEQEIGAKAVAELWTDLETVEQDDFAGALAVIDAKLPFDANFREFAVRNLNLDLPGQPISPNYADLDPAFPFNSRPPLRVGERDTGVLAIEQPGDPASTFDEDLVALSAHYYLFAPDPAATQFTLDFTGLSQRSAIDADAIVQLGDGNWERRQLATDAPVTFCRNDPRDDILQLYLILSNHAMDFATTVSGSFTVAVRDTPCT